MFLLNAAENHILRFAEDSRGVTIIEYALIISLVSIAIGFMIPEIRLSMDVLFASLHRFTIRSSLHRNPEQVSQIGLRQSQDIQTSIDRVLWSA